MPESTASELGQVLLVGGSTRISCSGRSKETDRKEPSKSLNPDECVALGASVQGGKLAGDAGAGHPSSGCYSIVTVH